MKLYLCFKTEIYSIVNQLFVNQIYLYSQKHIFSEMYTIYLRLNALVEKLTMTDRSIYSKFNNKPNIDSKHWFLLSCLGDKAYMTGYNNCIDT